MRANWLSQNTLLSPKKDLVSAKFNMTFIYLYTALRGDCTNVGEITLKMLQLKELKFIKN